MSNTIQLESQTQEKIIFLNKDQEAVFDRLLKIGVYKELHKKGLLSDIQLKDILSIQN